jgi:hypothetical protein
VTSRKEPFFTAKDAKALFRKIENAKVKVREGTDFENVATALDTITEGYLRFYHARTAPPAGLRLAWVQPVERHIGTLLKDFGLTGSLDHLNSAGTINAISALLQRIPFDDHSDRYLRQKMAAEIGAPEMLSEWQAIRLSLLSQQWLMNRTKLAVDTAKQGKGATRQPAKEEGYLVPALHALYAEVMTGKTGRYTTNPVNDRRSGPFLSFVAAVAAHIRSRRHIVEPPVPAEVAANLEAIAANPRRIIGRLKKIPRSL